MDDAYERNMRQAVDGHRQAAVAYVWGRQDGVGGEADSNEAWRFGQAYADHRERFLREQAFWATNLRDAYEVWRANGRIPTDSIEFGQLRAELYKEGA